MTLRHTTTLEWAANAPPPDDQIDTITAAVWADLESEGMDHPAQCVFDIISLTDDDAGPSVFVTGDRLRRVFHCRYRAVTEWE